jgi:hypothetical protein
MRNKSGIRIFLAAFVTLMFSCQTGAQEYSNKETRELNFGSGKKVFVIENIFGSINIVAVEGNKGELDIDQTINTENKADYEKAKDELKVKIEAYGDTVVVFIDAPFIKRKTNHGNFNCDFNDVEKKYRFHYNFVAKIPKDAEVIASTINDGDIHVSGIQGKMKVDNINGGIELNDVQGESCISTINGKIDVSYAQSPVENCNFKTINGDINIYCDKNLSADINYESMNGEFYTNYTIARLEPEIVKETKKMDGSTFYKIGQKSKFRIGNGKIKMSFETLNGDMTIKYKD